MTGDGGEVAAAPGTNTGQCFLLHQQIIGERKL
jgi:hypothetical protein